MIDFKIKVFLKAKTFFSSPSQTPATSNHSLLLWQEKMILIRAQYFLYPNNSRSLLCIFCAPCCEDAFESRSLEAERLAEIDVSENSIVN